MMNVAKLRIAAVPSGESEARFAEAIDPEQCLAQAARAELHRVLGSPHFEASERNRRFLEYVVEETLAGRADRIKAYSIATAVFGRDANFDPQTDPVVRMEARRLRRSLERFYLAEGTSNSVRLARSSRGSTRRASRSGRGGCAGRTGRCCRRQQESSTRCSRRVSH